MLLCPVVNCTLNALIYCTILKLTLHLQFLKHWKVLEHPHLIVGTRQQYIFTKGGYLHHNRPILYTSCIIVHTLLHPAFVPTIPSRRKKSHFSPTKSFCHAIQEAGWTYLSSPHYIHRCSAVWIAGYSSELFSGHKQKLRIWQNVRLDLG